MPSRHSCILAIALCLGGSIAAQELPATPPRPRLPEDALRPLAKPKDGAAIYAAMLAKAAEWQQQHPELVRRVDIGKSRQDRPLFVLRIGSAEPAAAEIYLGSGIHGSEGSESDAAWMIDRLLEQSDTPRIKELLRTRVLWLQLLVNPDGIVAQQRKNANGVDLNRNFAARWQGNPQRESRTYPGPSPFSEPETCAIRDFLKSRPHLHAYLDLHRSTSLLVIAQGADGRVDDIVREEGEALDAAMGKYSILHPQHMRGLSIDWVWCELGVVAFTMENRDTTTAKPEEDARWLGLQHLLEQAPRLPQNRAAVASQSVGTSAK